MCRTECLVMDTATQIQFILRGPRPLSQDGRYYVKRSAFASRDQRFDSTKSRSMNFWFYKGEPSCFTYGSNAMFASWGRGHIILCHCCVLQEKRGDVPSIAGSTSAHTTGLAWCRGRAPLPGPTGNTKCPLPTAWSLSQKRPQCSSHPAHSLRAATCSLPYTFQYLHRCVKSMSVRSSMWQAYAVIFVCQT